MYIYNYIHVWRAARNVKNPPANNYARYCEHSASGTLSEADALRATSCKAGPLLLAALTAGRPLEAPEEGLPAGSDA